MPDRHQVYKPRFLLTLRSDHSSRLRWPSLSRNRSMTRSWVAPGAGRHSRRCLLDQNLRLHISLELRDCRKAPIARLTGDGHNLGTFVQQDYHRLAEFLLDTV